MNVLKNKVKHIGAEKHTFIFTIDVKRVVFSGGNFYDYDGGLLSICFERGGKIACTKDRLYNSNSGSNSPMKTSNSNRSGSNSPLNKKNIHVLDINESISLVVTLYKDNAKTMANHNIMTVYQEKIGKIILRQYKKSSHKNNNSHKHHNNSTYVGLGSFKLNLHSLVNDVIVNGLKDFIWKLDGIEDVSCYARMHVRMLKSGEDMDDVLSMISDHSESSMSAVGASFENSSGHSPESRSQRNVDSKYNNTNNSGSSGSMSRGHNSADNVNSLESIPETLHEIEKSPEKGHSNHSYTNMTSDQSHQLSNPPLPPYHNNHDNSGSPIAGSTNTSHTTHTHTHSPSHTHHPYDNTEGNTEADREHDSNSSKDSTSEKSVKHGKRFPFLNHNTNTNSPSSSIPLHLGLKGKTTRTSSEILELQTEVSHLRRIIKSKDEEINLLKNNFTTREIDYKNQFITLKTDLNVAQSELTRLKVGRSAVAQANEKADGVLATALARARDETAAIAEDYALTSAQLSNTEAECLRLTQELNALKILRDEDRNASLEAATIASAASFRRAELENENSLLLDELINIKMKYATIAMEIDEEKKKNFVLKKRLQKYAERVASLEVSQVAYHQ